MMKVALAGNPNSGKTTLFNKLTGASAHVGNWPGVTIEKKEGTIRGRSDITLIDLPGVYSLSPYTPDERITRNFLVEEKPDVIINIVDASNIERNLYLTSQIIDMGIPMIIALNMMDVVKKNGESIDIPKLEGTLRCKVVPISAAKVTGLEELIKALDTPLPSPHSGIFSPTVTKALLDIKSLLPEKSFYSAIKTFERDEESSSTPQIESIISDCEKSLNDDSESIIISERYNFIEKAVAKCCKKRQGVHFSNKLDKILTHKYLALPIFVLIMWSVYYLAVTSIGAYVTEFANDVVFGGVVTDWVSGLLTNAGAEMWLHGLIVDGIIGGVGAVLGFVPQLLILFILLSFLEDCGYMARVAFIMDRLFRKFGLSGKSFIPLLVSSGCGVPGIMASRTIEDKNERRRTIIVTTFIPCGAKLPIIALIAGSFFPNSSLVAPLVYFLGIAMVVLSGIILKKAMPKTDSPFVMELPLYHLPSPKSIAKHSFERIKSFVVKAGTVIFLACGLIWFLSNFNFSLQMVESSESILATIGSFIAPIFAPLGFGSWEATVATLTGLVAKENVVGSLGVLIGSAEIATIFTGMGAISFMCFNMLCAPCLAAIGAIRKEMNSAAWTLFAVGYQTGLAYVMSLIIYQLGMLFTGSPLSAGTIVAFALILALIWLAARRNTNKTVTVAPYAA